MLKKFLVFFGVFSFLFGCRSNPYQKKNGKWYYDGIPVGGAGKKFKPLNNRFASDEQFGYYRGASIYGSNGPSFEALSDRFAKDKMNVYYCDTYRKGQEYFSIKHDDVRTVQGAEPASFTFLEYCYGKDRLHVFFKSGILPVKDVNSYERLKYSFAKDKVTGYYCDAAIPGSDGASFEVLDDKFTRDKNHVYFSESRMDKTPSLVMAPINGADPLTFSALDDSYARDTINIYYRDKIIEKQSAAFLVLGRGYAKNEKQVFYNGERLPADAATFNTQATMTDSTDASDKNSSYYYGKRTK